MAEKHESSPCPYTMKESLEKVQKIGKTKDESNSLIYSEAYARSKTPAHIKASTKHLKYVITLKTINPICYSYVQGTFSLIAVLSK